ncbi:MAG: hypothetical protein JNK93_14435 [Planctomycetia bacterium]|nr:hypothetical protein [Planctomycetia bacterium]
MTLERWKLLAGGFGIAIVGVVAMANPQCPGKTDPAREKAPPTREVVARPVDAPKPITLVAPKPEPATTPGIPDIVVGAVPPIIDPLPSVPALPVSRKAETVVEIPLPKTSPPVLPTVSPLTIELPKVEVTPNSIPNAAPPVLSPLPSIPSSPPPAIVAVEPAKARPAPNLAPAQPAAIALTPTPFLEPQAAAPAIKEEVETRVRVVVPLGKSQAKFEVLTGETVLLQAVCEAVEVRSPGDKSEKGSAASPIKASGKVRFTAPGCEGTCDTLAVLPGTGEVELTGSVRVTCKHGKAETEIQATTMKFKLGSAPAVVAVSAKGD